MMAVTIPIPAAVITHWVANNGSENYGVLLRCDAGWISLRMSQFVSATAPKTVRPALDVIFEGGDGWSGYPEPGNGTDGEPPPPVDLGNTDPQPPAVRKADGTCAVLAGSHFDLDVSSLPVHPNSPSIISAINNGNAARGMHADFASTDNTGAGVIYAGIPFITVDSDRSKAQPFAPGPTDFYLYPTESDLKAGIPYGSRRYPFPRDAPIEGAYPGCSMADCNTDRHVLVVDNFTCTLYEAWKCEAPADASSPWRCANGAAFNLSNPLLPQRPLGWTSADAAGLPIYPGLIKVEEIKAGVINHAIRFTSFHVQPAYAYPATHIITAHGSAPDDPWMGLRARLRSGFNCAGLTTAPGKTVCAALKKYGVIMSDVGSSWFLTGEASSKWAEAIPNFDAFAADLDKIKGADMQVVMPAGRRVIG